MLLNTCITRGHEPSQGSVNLELGMRYLVLFALTLPIARSAPANPIYRWVDEQGVANYTNDASKVPRGVKAETTSGDEITVVASGRRPSSAPAPALLPASISSGILTQEERAVADQWRSAFRDAHARIGRLELAARLDAQTVEAEGARFGRGPGRHASLESGNLEVQQRIEWNLAELKRARAELAELERAASREAIPREWRQP